MIIAFKDDYDGFYQVEIMEVGEMPKWTNNLVQLTEEERLLKLESSYKGEIPIISW